MRHRHPVARFLIARARLGEVTLVTVDPRPGGDHTSVRVGARLARPGTVARVPVRSAQHGWRHLMRSRKHFSIIHGDI